MNILFILPYVPSQIRARSFNLIKELSKRHNVYVLCLSDETSKADANEIKKYAKDLCIIQHSQIKGYIQALLSVFTPIPASVAFCKSKKAKDAVLYTMQNQLFDVVHIEHLRAISLIPKNVQLPMVFDSVDCLTDLFFQMAKMKKNPIAKIVNFIEAVKLRFYEPHVIKRFKKTVITSANDKRKLKSFNRNLVIDVIGHGIDTEYFKPDPTCGKNPHRIVFNGKMSYAPNAISVIWFAKNVFPLIKEKYTDAEFIIVGSSPPANVKALENTDGITVTGFVDDLRPYLASASISVVPMQIAVGVQTKLMEAMAMGLPVISTSISAPVSKAEGLIISDEPQDMANKISELFDDTDKCKKLGEAARNFAVKTFSYDMPTKKLETIYNRVTGKE